MRSHWNHISRYSGITSLDYHWLSDPRSLTKKIKNQCHQGFQVQLISQTWRSIYYDEATILDLVPYQQALIREVILTCHNKPWVFARTVLPRRSLIGKTRQLAYLKNKPLGEVLFSSPQTKRQLIEMTRLQKKHPLFNKASAFLVDKPDILWGRRTLFYFAQQPLLVNEIFLPQCGR